MVSIRPFAALSLVALAVACGGGGQETPPPAAPPPSAPATATPSATPGATPGATAGATPGAPASTPVSQPGPGDWTTWTHEKKLAWMKAGVMPKMHGVFAGYDASKYGDITCKTCHGAGVSQGNFSMPNADLPKLDPTPDGFAKLAKSNPKMLDFMMKQVEPTMASLLGEEPFDMKTKVGFGCFNCHTKK